MEEYLGRKLTSEEVVHHIDGNPANNDLENLQVKSVSDHARDHRPPPELVSIICAGCGRTVIKRARYVRHNQKQQHKYGPFCGRSCSGKWSRQQQIDRGINRNSEPRHGTDNSYKYHRCRCTECRKAHAQTCRRQRFNRRGRGEILVNTLP